MDLPPQLIAGVQKHTNAPWWNGAAYADYRGYPGQIRAYANGIGEAVDDLAEVISALRADRRFVEADRLRTIAGRLARLRPESETDAGTVRHVAKGWK
jgi:hypothetical protein